MQCWIFLTLNTKFRFQFYLFFLREILILFHFKTADELVNKICYIFTNTVENCAEPKTFETSVTKIAYNIEERIYFNLKYHQNKTLNCWF